MSEKLLPCPFCNGEAEMHGSDTRPLIVGWFVRCTACETSTRFSECADSGASVIAAWNTRAQTPPPAVLPVVAWQPIETAQRVVREPVLLMWSSRGPSSGYWDLDEEFESRPKGWVSPEFGWRGHQDMCIPRDQEHCTHWMPLPAPPTIAAASGGQQDRGEG